ncbi:MAG: T9SS type A sorting domain-containing protein [Balneola sp.]
MAGKKIIRMSASAEHVILETDEGEFWAFGRNSNGELGDGTQIPKLSPFRIDTIFPDTTETIKKAIAGRAISLIITESGKVFSFGYRNGPLGFDSAPASDVLVPTEITHSNLSGKTIVDGVFYGVNDENALLLASDGSIFSFGSAGYGLGRPIVNNRVPVQVIHSGLSEKTIVEIASVGAAYVYAKASDGSIFTFGGDSSDEVTIIYTSKSSGTGRWGAQEKYPREVNVSQMDGKTVARMIPGLNYTYFITTDSLLYTFGAASGDTYIGPVALRSNYPSVNTPTLIPPSAIGGYPAKNVFAGGKQTYVINTQNQVYQFGKNSKGELGITDSLDQYTPVLMDASLIDNKVASQIAIGYNDSIAVTFIVTEDGSVYGFGANSFGQLGLGDNVKRAQLVQLTHANLSGKTIIHAATNGIASLLVASDGTVFTFGYNLNGTLGHGSTTNLNIPTPLTHATVTEEKIVSGSVGTQGLGGSFFVLLRADGKIITFGENSDGQLGQGDKVDNNTPRIVTHASISNKKIIKTQSGTRGTLILTDDGEVFGFGNAVYVGFNISSFTDYIVPTKINSTNVSGRYISDIAFTYQHTLLQRQDGTVLASAGNGNVSELSVNRGVLGTGDPSQAQKEHVEITDFNTYQSPIPTTNLALHLNAARTGFVSSNDSLNTWGDLSSSDNDGTQTILAQRPVLVDSAINNQPVVRFNGSNSYVTLPTASDLGIQNSDYEMFVVAKSRTVNSNISFLVAGSAERYELHLNGTSGARFIPTTSTYIDNGSVGDFSDATTQLYNVRATSTEAIMSVNRNATVSSVNAQSSDNGTIILGARTGGFFWLDGDIAEVIIYNNILSENDRRAVESYLFKKYAIQNYKESQAQLTGTEGWRILTSPVADSSFAPLLDNLWTQGFTGAKTTFGFPNVYRWPNTATSLSDTNWTAVSSLSDSLNPGEGILVYVFSDDNGPGVAGDGGFPKTLKLEGREPKGTQSLTSLLNSNINGWALVGNPFRNDIDWDGFTRSGLSNSVYVYDTNSSSWKSWNGSLGSLTDGEVGAFNAFFVQTISGSPSLEIPESAKKDSAKRFLGKVSPVSNPSYFSLEFKSDSGYANKAWFQFSETGEFGIDASDAYQLNPLSSKYVTIASALNDSIHLDINSLPQISKAYEVKLALQTTETGGAHRISKTDFNLPEGWEISLHDSELDVTTNLSEPYVFTMASVKAKMQNLASPPSLESIVKHAKQKQAEARFTLTITPATTVNGEPFSDLPQTVELEQNYPNPFNPSSVIQFGVPELSKVRLEVFDILGRKVATLLNDEVTQAGRYNVQFHAGNLASGMYVYRLQVGNKVLTKKMTLIK